MNMSPAEAKMELALLNSKVHDFSREDVFVRLTNSGLPLEVVFRLEELWEATKVTGKQVIHTGKIIIYEILRFIEQNPNLAIGVAVGAAIGALTSLIPFLGSLLAPIAIAIGLVVGSVAGSRLDRGQAIEVGAIGITQEIISCAKKFFELFANIFMALKSDFVKE